MKYKRERHKYNILKRYKEQKSNVTKKNFSNKWNMKILSSTEKSENPATAALQFLFIIFKYRSIYHIYLFANADLKDCHSVCVKLINYITLILKFYELLKKNLIMVWTLKNYSVFNFM
jgi:hypothetical protein